MGLVRVAVMLALLHDGGAAAVVQTTVRGLRSTRGRVGCMSFGAAAGFPNERALASRSVWCPISGEAATCALDGVASGPLAVACFHDENGNGTLDRGLFGIPQEGWVVTRGARGFLGPPKFDDARITFDGGVLELQLQVTYP